ncbi:MAG: HAD family hydrolase [Candidatus Nanopelagicales bacterium]
MPVLTGPLLPEPVPIATVVFDMDGVVTDTATLHRYAWKKLFDDYLRQRAETSGEAVVEFTEADYLSHVDGKRREDGVTSFLIARGIEPSAQLVTQLATDKDNYFLSIVERDGVVEFPDTISFIHSLTQAGVQVALITASRNAVPVLGGAGHLDLFQTRVDGIVAAELGLPGKPDPAVFLEAMARVGGELATTAIVEDAVSGVQAGRAGGFALVIGVDRTQGAEHGPRLAANGADIVVDSLAQVTVST